MILVKSMSVESLSNVSMGPSAPPSNVMRPYGPNGTNSAAALASVPNSPIPDVEVFVHVDDFMPNVMSPGTAKSLVTDRLDWLVASPPRQ